MLCWSFPTVFTNKITFVTVCGKIKFKGNQHNYKMDIYDCVTLFCLSFPTVFTPCNHFFLGYFHGTLQAFILMEEDDTDSVVLNVSPVTSPFNSLGLLYKMTDWSSLKPVLLGSV